MQKKITIKTIYLLFVISIGLIGLGVGSTYAVFTANDTIANPISFTSNLTFDSQIMEVIDVTIAAGKTKNITLNVTNSSDASINYTTWYVEQDNSIDFDIGIGDGSANTTGSLSSNGSNTVIVSIRNNENTSINVTVGVSSSTDSVVLDNNMKVVPNQLVLPNNLVELINYLYTNASKGTVNNGEGNSLVTYNIANIYDTDEDTTSSGGLINDRLGSMDVDANGGNIRYYGANPNNYIYFNCETYPETNCETWRIIGVFGDKVKIIRNSTIGDYSWDYKYDGLSTSFSNDWTSATLMTLLNEDYYNNRDGVTYYNNSTTKTTINFANPADGVSKGITQKTRDKGLIADVSWNLGGLSSNYIYSGESYKQERGDAKCSSCTYNITWPGKIALAYPSDYGYAMEFSDTCNLTLDNYSNTTCSAGNWMKLVLKSDDNWFLNPYSNDMDHAWNVMSDGFVDQYNYGVHNANGVAPVLYLNSRATIESGDGSSGNPYRLSVS